MKTWYLGFVTALIVVHANAQPIASFTTPPTACREEIIPFENNSISTSGYLWDFCHTDLLNLPETSVPGAFPVTGSNKLNSIEVLEWEGEWVGFVLDIAAAKLLRLDYGNDLETFPTVVDLGNLTNNLTTPATMDFLLENGVYYGFLVNAFSNNVIRITFGDGLKSLPTLVENLGTAGNTINTPFGIEVINAAGTVYIYVLNYSVNNISVIKLGNSAANAPESNKVIGSDDGLVNPWDMKLKEQNGNWYGLISSLGNSKLYHCDFGNDPYGTPVITEAGTVPQGTAVELVKEGLTYVAFVRARYDGLFRVEFGETLSNTTPIVTSLGNLGGVLSDESRSLKLIRETPGWKGLTLEYNNGKMILMEFLNDCTSAVSGNTSNLTEPSDLDFKIPGDYYIELTAFDEQGRTSVASQIITVVDQYSPVIEISVDTNRCTLASNTFTVSSNSPLSSYNWNFGDLTSAADENPTHMYSASGIYTVNLQVTATTGCKNNTSIDLKIYDPPSVDFSVPTGIVCTNNELVFTNNTPDHFDGNLFYKWYVDGTFVNDDRDLLYSFSTTADKAIKLITLIPGCSAEISKTVSNVQEGPFLDFVFNGECLGESTTFAPQISEDVSGYSWDFDDGTTSSLQSPTHLFQNSGVFSVSFTANSQSGCNNTKVKTIEIKSLPSVDFTISPPPLSCTGTSTQFSNLTADPPDGTITSWLWTFDDATATENTSSLQDPSHTFANAGSYDVTLTATTEEGCSGTLQKAIAIEQSPSATVENSVACKSLPVNFTATGTDLQSYYWEIGTSYYTDANPTHTFSVPGDYQILLTIQGNNNCETTYERFVSVPVPLEPDFSVLKNCIDHQTEFTDITLGADPVAQQAWDFDGMATATGSPAVHSFNSLGSKSITLNVTAESGCSYSVSRTIDIAQAPTANFDASPETGAMPLAVQFTNTSTAATLHEWTFGDEAQGTSNEISPSYTFQNTGEFLTELKASNSEGCESTATKLITVVAPLPDVDIRRINVSENPDGSMQLIITLENKGNTFLENLPVDVNISGKVALREVIEESIAPASLYNLVLSYSLTQLSGLSFLCASTTLANDLVPEGNQICIELDDKVFLFSPYPNPVKNDLELTWIAPAEETVTFTLVDAFGKTVLSSSLSSTPGLNRTVYDVTHLGSGIYILTLKAGSASKTQRIVISREN